MPVKTVQYAPGRLADVFGEPAQPTILLWHGMQTDARETVRPLAGMLAGHGAAVVVPDWNSQSADGGRSDLLGSLELAREHADDRAGLVLVGWSLGGAAAAGLTIERSDVALAHTVCLAGAFMVPDPICGRVAADGLPADRAGAPFTLLHGVDDHAVPVTASRDFASHLQRAGWPVDLIELPADHGSIAGADYDRDAQRYVPARGGPALAMAREVAERISATLRYE
ncbi:hypothetical protein MPRM_11270 [Mycobacterium parmense]|uniref:Esterase n=1 Tax=Mycobacterium parmense TaxID=185642 RepID=A0A7I7YPN8_9MYCO|nr:hypothetical protein MPRM_11270 [Mycobacterium parmense]